VVKPKPEDQSGWQRMLRGKRKRTKIRFLANWLEEKMKDICETILTAEVRTAMTQASRYKLFHKAGAE
jgi:hypothetical protein